jgi:hypothetical protein
VGAVLAETVGWRWAFVAPLPLIMLAVFLVIPSIYLKGHDPAAEPGILVHECTHVWQYQNRSSRYSTDAIGAQWFADAAYNWENDLASGAARWKTSMERLRGSSSKTCMPTGT